MIASSTVSVVLMSGLALANVLPRSAPVQIQLTTDYGCITQADLGKGRPNVDTTKIFCANGYPLGWPNSLEKTFNKPFTLYTEADESFGFCVNADELPKCQLDVCLGNIPKGTTQLNYQAKERCLFDQNGKKLDKLCCLQTPTRKLPVLNPYLQIIPMDQAIKLCQEGTNRAGTVFPGNEDY